MKFLGKLISVIFYGLLPKSLHSAVKTRISGVKSAFTSNLELRIFWKVLFFPIVLLMSLIIACMKSLFLFISPKAYGYLKFIINQMYTDITRDHRSFKITCKRARLTIELIIKGRERRVSYGEKNPDKIFFVIRPYYYLTKNELATSLSDLLFHYYRNLQQLSYAINNSWIPVVDWENYLPLRHMEDYPVNGTMNGWEYYWRQPSEYTLEEVYSSKNVILANRNSVNYGYIPTPFLTPPFSKYVADLAERCPEYDQYFKFNSVTDQYVTNYYHKLFPQNARILGVSIRGAAYGKHPVQGHPKQPSLKKLIMTVRKSFIENNMDYVYFACESEECVNQMQDAFKDQLIVLPRKRMAEEPKEGEINPLYYPGQRYQTNLDYLTEMFLLSNCTALMAGMSSGTRVAVIWNANRYEFVHIFDNGLW